MSIPGNEGRVCDAVVRLLEARTGTFRSEIRHPERDGVGPPVDLRLRLGSQEYAIEHSQIEALPGQIHTAVEFGRFINPVIDELSGLLPGPAVYDLDFPFNARLGVPPAQLEQIRRDFIEWIRVHALELHEKNPERPTREKNPRECNDRYRGTPPGFPYEVTLRRKAHWSTSGVHDGVLLPTRIVKEDVETRRVDRLWKTLDRKCPKLHTCKEQGARTVLVLEDNDIALSNHVLIEDGLAGLLEERADLPDEIYLVESSVKTWGVRIIKCDEAIFPEQDWTNFDSADLIDITGNA